MSKTIKQYRYYGDGNQHNQPVDTISKESMYAGDVFISDQMIQEFGMITSIGIQGLPGTKIYINESASPILLGMMGTFELDLSNYGFIYKLQVDYNSASIIENTENGYLIVDVIYDTEV